MMKDTKRHSTFENQHKLQRSASRFTDVEFVQSFSNCGSPPGILISGNIWEELLDDPTGNTDGKNMPKNTRRPGRPSMVNELSTTLKVRGQHGELRFLADKMISIDRKEECRW